MPFEKGRQKTGGRKKGVINNDKRIIRDNINKLLNAIDILELYEKQKTAKDKRDMLLGLIEYSIPKLQRTTIEGDANNPLQIIWNETRTYDSDQKTNIST